MQKNRLFKLTMLIALSFSTSLVAQDKSIDAVKVLTQSNLNLDYKTLDAGEIVTFARKDLELTDTSIALSMALYVKAPYEKVLKDIKASGNALSSYPDALLIKIEDNKNLKLYFKKIMFTKNESNEVDDLFDFDGGDSFNLSKEEIKKWKDASKNSKDKIQTASIFYQEILEKRLLEYQEKGIKGISTYRHLGADTSVALGMEKSSAFLNSFKKLIPDLYSDYMNFPKTTSKGTKQSFFILKDELEGRPTFILKHQMSKENANMFVVAERQFYISHDLDAIQTQILCIPYKDGTLIALSSQSYTPKVSGFARGMAVEIGRKMMGKQILPMLEKIQKKYK